jgi:hypothetical protein
LPRFAARTKQDAVGGWVHLQAVWPAVEGQFDHRILHVNTLPDSIALVNRLAGLARDFHQGQTGLGVFLFCNFAEFTYIPRRT